MGIASQITKLKIYLAWPRSQALLLIGGPVSEVIHYREVLYHFIAGITVYCHLIIIGDSSGGRL
jgi:hypothetical protein